MMDDNGVDLSQLGQAPPPDISQPTPMPTYTGTASAAAAGNPALQSALANLQSQPQPSQPSDSSQQDTIGNGMPSQSPRQDVKALTMQNAQQNLAQQQVSGKGLKGMLQRFAYGFGQAAMHEAGLPTDQDLLNNAVQRGHLQAQTQLVQQQIQQAKTMTPVQFPNGTIGYYPQAIAAKLQGQITAASARTGAAQITADSRTAMNNINAQLKARNIGVQLDFDENGNPVMKNQTQDQIAAPVAAKMASKPNEIQLIQKAQAGDPDAQKTLDTLQSRKVQLAAAQGSARGKAFGYYRPMTYYDPDQGQNVTMFAGDAMMAQQAGKNLIPSGTVPASTLIGLQRLNSEATPAIQGVQDNLKAFDNPGDRAVFARILKDNPMSDGQDPHTWMGNILDQSLKGGLSPQGQQLAVKLNRLNETVSLLRSTLGLPASNGATALTLRMIPGASTPNSDFAGKQLNELKQVVQQSNVKALGGSAGGNEKPSTPGAPVKGQVKNYNGAAYQFDGTVWRRKN